ncbi:MAG: MarR family winged helix-turn-helix transcriptional regulator [Notoacmeibacter sp.]|nr:MarR family winged helix-turn-helix transcriptional regulator [Notoacmeibacter sp.]
MSDIDPDSIGFLVSDLARLIRAAMDRANAASGIGVTPGEARVLAYSARSGPVRQNRLAELIGIEAMTLSGYLDALEAKGLIAREADPADRRAKIVRLLPAADSVLEAIAGSAAALRGTLSAGFTAGEWAELKAALIRIRSNLCERAEEKPANE